VLGTETCPLRPRSGCAALGSRAVGPIVVEVRRGAIVEARHRVHAVAVQAGRIVSAHGDPELVTHMRSSAKPLQALPLARARPDLDDRELAIASASHLADQQQLDAVRSLLAKAGASEDDLECGPVGDPPSRLRHNCSGKHAGMLVLARAHGWPPRGYRLPEHPVQRAMLAEVAAAGELEPATIPTAVDGCGVVTFALTLERMASAFARLERLDGGSRVAAAMRRHPDLVRGPAAADTRLMRGLAGWVAKGGAEGLLCAAGPDGVGVALKVEDGHMRATAPAAAALLAGLGHRVEELATAPVLNSRGERVGKIAALVSVL
jgi:L-asparaginase II